MIGDRTLDEWKSLARHDDCFKQMVPSDLRIILGALERQILLTQKLQKNLDRVGLEVHEIARVIESRGDTETAKDLRDAFVLWTT